VTAGIGQGLRRKGVWDLSLEEIEYVHGALHMNEYVYAALKTCRSSSLPLGRSLALRTEAVPECLRQGARDLAALSPYLGNADPGTVRINSTYRCFEVLRNLRLVKREELGAAIETLAALAYVQLLSEKNDGLYIWKHPAVREPSRYERPFQGISESIDLAAYIDLVEADPGSGERPPISAMETVFRFIPPAAASVIAMIENEIGAEEALAAFRRIEGAMLRFEAEHGLGNRPGLPGNVLNPGQLRYRNTIYLYGGNHLERMGRAEEASSWYSRDIYFLDLPRLFGFYLTALKAIERLLCAYRVAPSSRELILLRELIDRCLLAAFGKAAEYADAVLRHIVSHPGMDLRVQRMPADCAEGYLLFGGEASREVFLIALLYNNIVNGVEYSRIDYGRILA
jgi:hypothetical protein